MSDLLEKSSTDKPKKRWRKSVESNGVTCSIAVREIENGFIINYNKYGKEPDADNYTEIDREYFSEKNPLEKKEDAEKDLLGDMSDLAGFSIESLL